MKKTIAIVAVMALLVAMLCGCGSAAQQAPAAEATPAAAEADAAKDAAELLIGYTTYSDTEESCLEFEQGMLDAAAKYGVKTVNFNSNADPAAQTTGIENFISQGVDAMCIGAVDSDAIVPVIDQARADGITVINFDIVANTEIDGYVGVDNGALAALCAEYLAEAVNHEGKVLVYEIPPSVVSIAERVAAEVAVFEKYGMEVVYIAPADPIRDSEMTVCENALMANPDTVGIVGVDTDTTMAALLACEAQGMTEVKVCGPNLVNETKEIIATGERQLIAMADAKNYDVGYAAMEMTIKAALGEEVSEYLVTEFEMCGPDRCKEMLAE